MAKVRVMLANMPQMLTHILRDLVNRQPDMAIVGEVRRLADLPTLVASLRPQAVILTFSPLSSGCATCGALRAHHPALLLLGLAPRNDRAVAWPPDAPPEPIEMSAAAILRALRGHAERDRD